MFRHTVNSSYRNTMYRLFLFSAGVLSLWKPLDYETVNTYVITFSIRDDFLESIESKSLTLNVENVNEGNWIETSVASVTFKETVVSKQSNL